MPPKHEFVISVKLSEIQVKMYQSYLENLSLAKKGVKCMSSTLFVDFNNLRCIWNHPYMCHVSHEKNEYRKVSYFIFLVIFFLEYMSLYLYIWYKGLFDKSMSNIMFWGHSVCRWSSKKIYFQWDDLILQEVYECDILKVLEHGDHIIPSWWSNFGLLWPWFPFYNPFFWLFFGLRSI